MHPLICMTACLLWSSMSNAQEQKQEQKNDEHKIQEVVTITADPVTVPPAPDGSLPPADTSSAIKPMPQTEIIKRAVNYIKTETSKYTKSNGVNVASKAECTVTFNYKPKELNPQADVEGTFTMHVSIEAKDGKYRYSISKVLHNAKNDAYSGGNVYNEVPKCGSMKMPPELWHRIQSEAKKSTTIVINDIKEHMKRPANAITEKSDEW